MLLVLARAGSAQVATPLLPAGSTQSAAFYGVLGEVARPGTYQTGATQLTAGELLRAAGGLTNQASGTLRVVRNGRLAFVASVSVADRTTLLAGDLLVVEARRTAWATGFARRARTAASASGPRRSSRPVQLAFVGLVPGRPLVVKVDGQRATVRQLVADLGQPPELADAVRILPFQRAGRFSLDADSPLPDCTVLVFDPDHVDPAGLPPLPPAYALKPPAASPPSGPRAFVRAVPPAQLPGSGSNAGPSGPAAASPGLRLPSPSGTGLGARAGVGPGAAGSSPAPTEVARPVTPAAPAPLWTGRTGPRAMLSLLPAQPTVPPPVAGSGPASAAPASPPSSGNRAETDGPPAAGSSPEPKARASRVDEAAKPSPGRSADADSPGVSVDPFGNPLVGSHNHSTSPTADAGDSATLGRSPPSAEPHRGGQRRAARTGLAGQIGEPGEATALGRQPDAASPSDGEPVLLRSGSGAVGPQLAGTLLAVLVISLAALAAAFALLWSMAREPAAEASEPSPLSPSRVLDLLVSGRLPLREEPAELPLGTVELQGEVKRVSHRVDSAYGRVPAGHWPARAARLAVAVRTPADRSAGQAREANSEPDVVRSAGADDAETAFAAGLEEGAGRAGQELHAAGPNSAVQAEHTEPETPRKPAGSGMNSATLSSDTTVPEPAGASPPQPFAAGASQRRVRAERLPTARRRSASQAVSEPATPAAASPTRGGPHFGLKPGGGTTPDGSSPGTGTNSVLDAALLAVDRRRTEGGQE